jgi:hypothetical protein
VAIYACYIASEVWSKTSGRRSRYFVSINVLSGPDNLLDVKNLYFPLTWFSVSSLHAPGSGFLGVAVPGDLALGPLPISPC